MMSTANVVDRPTQLICMSDMSTDKYKRHSRAICYPHTELVRLILLLDSDPLSSQRVLASTVLAVMSILLSEPWRCSKDVFSLVQRIFSWRSMRRCFDWRWCVRNLGTFSAVLSPGQSFMLDFSTFLLFTHSPSFQPVQPPCCPFQFISSLQRVALKITEESTAAPRHRTRM